MPVAPGVVLEIAADHPLARQAGRYRELAHSVRVALGQLLAGRESEGSA